MTPANRFLELIKRDLCFQCLFPGATRSKGKHKEGRCQRDFVCPHESHDEYPTKRYILVCDEHKQHPQNQELLQQYKDRFITRQRSVNLPNYSNFTQTQCHKHSLIKMIKLNLN